MDAIFIMFILGIYGICVLILAAIWDKIILKLIKKTDYQKSNKEFINYIKKIANDNSIMIKDKATLKLLIAIDLLYIVAFVFVATWFYLTPEEDAWKEMARKGGLALCAIMIFYKIYHIFYILHSKNFLIPKIKISQNIIEYSIYDRDICLDLNLDNCIKLTYGYLPIFDCKKEKNNKLLSDDRYGAYFFIPLGIFIALLQHIMFFILNFFKIKQYAIIETDKYIFSIPLKKELLKLSKNLKFNIKTIINI